MEQYLQDAEKRILQAQIEGKKAVRQYVVQILSNILEESKKYAFLFKDSKINFISYFIARDETEKIVIKFDENGNVNYDIPRNTRQGVKVYSPEQIADHLISMQQKKDLNEIKKLAKMLVENYLDVIKEPLGTHLANEHLKGLEQKLLAE